MPLNKQKNNNFHMAKELLGYFIYKLMRNFHGVVANVINCNIIVSKFELQLHYYIHF